jgi:hypothetical protein
MQAFADVRRVLRDMTLRQLRVRAVMLRAAVNSIATCCGGFDGTCCAACCINCVLRCFTCYVLRVRAASLRVSRATVLYVLRCVLHVAACCVSCGRCGGCVLRCTCCVLHVLQCCVLRAAILHVSVIVRRCFAHCDGVLCAVLLDCGYGRGSWTGYRWTTGL